MSLPPHYLNKRRAFDIDEGDGGRGVYIYIPQLRALNRLCFVASHHR